MKQNPTIERASGNAGPNEPVRKPILVLIGVVFLVCAGGVIFFANRDRTGAKPPEETAAPEPAAAPAQGSIGKAPATVGEEVVETTGAAVPAPAVAAQMVVPRQTRPLEADPSRPQPSPETRQLVTFLTQFDLSHGPITPEAAAAWKQNLQQLTTQGVAAVPAIREFLEKNLDQTFDAASGNLLGQSTARLAMLEALQNIGGPEAMAVSSQMLQTTLDPREIAFLAQSLEQQAPGQYGVIAAQAARDALAAAGAGQLEGRDVGALFGVLQKFGGPDAVADLQKYSGPYRYYATIALANLPDGAGISALIDMVSNPDMVSKGSRVPALQMLAQAALASPEALDALVEQARLNQIPGSTWQNISSILCGDQMRIGTAPVESGVRSFHLASGNQNFYTVPDRSPWPPDQVSRYIAVENKLAAVNSNPMAATALQNALACLQARQQ